MSGISKFKRIYSEGVAAEHPDVAGQKEFANRADAEITRRRKERAKKGGPQLPGFVPSVKKEEVELDEKIDVGADAGATISDFVHSKSATFKGDSKKQRIKRALGAYYAAQKEETENIYNYVIETLVDSDFARDYETAENMFECMSDEFVAVILEEYIEEARRSRTERRAANAGRKGYDAKGNPIPRVSTTHIIHDVDDNLADQSHPDASRIDVMRKIKEEWEKERSLTPGEFAHHKLKSGRKYGFDEFRDTDKFKKTTKKTKVARMGDSPRRPAKKSVVTARGGSAFGSNKPSTPMDDPKSFAKDLRDRIGVRGIEKPNIHFTGGMSKGPNKGLSGPEKKAKVVAQIVNPDTKKVITTDDHLGNTRAMAAAASAAAPQSKVIAYQSRPATRKPKGKGKVGDIVPSRVGKENKPEDTNIGIRPKPDAPKSTKQTQRARKKARKNMGEEVSSYEYWKQFVGEAAYTGGPVGRSEMIASNNERAKQSSTSSSPTSTTTRPGTTPTPKPQSSTGGLLGSLDKLARDTAGKVGEKIGRNKTGNIPIISDIGGAVGRQKGKDMYDKVTAPFRKEEVSSYEYWKQFVD
jgi:hypothetical protein